MCHTVRPLPKRPNERVAHVLSLHECCLLCAPLSHRADLATSLAALPPQCVDPFLVTLAGIRDGIEVLESNNLLEPLVQRWLARDATVHTVDVNTRITVALVATSSTANPSPSTLGVPTTTGGGSSGGAGPTVIPVTLPAELLGGSAEAGGHSLDTLLRLPWRVEVWADYETESAPPAILTNVSVKAGKMLGLVPMSPRARTGSFGNSSPAVGSAGTASFFDSPASPSASARPASAAFSSGYGSFSESDRPDVTKHSIPIRCDAIVDLSSIRCGGVVAAVASAAAALQWPRGRLIEVCDLVVAPWLSRPEDMCNLRSNGTRVRVRATVLGVGGSPKPEVVPPGSKLRAALFRGTVQLLASHVASWSRGAGLSRYAGVVGCDRRAPQQFVPSLMTCAYGQLLSVVRCPPCVAVWWLPLRGGAVSHSAESVFR